MKKIITLALSFVLLFSVTAFAGDESVSAAKTIVSPDGEVIAQLIPLPDDYPIPEEYQNNARWSSVIGYYVAGDGVAARRPYGIKSPVIGRLYSGDIIWTQDERKNADGYEWIHFDSDQNSNMGAVPDLWMVTDYLGDIWR